MAVILILLAIACIGAGLFCSVKILIDAFQDELWKGVVCLLCGLYFLYYSLFEYEDENKWVIVLTSLAASSVGGAIFGMAGSLSRG